MTTALKQLAESVIQLPAEDRAFLAEKLIASFDESELDQAWKNEAGRRQGEISSGKVKPIAAAEVVSTH